MANAKTPGGEHLDFDELFAGEQQQPPATNGQAGKENLQELEAFLDDFEKNLDSKAAPQPAAAPVAAAASPLAEPHEAEELVHGLLKEDELNLDVQGAAADKAAEEFEPHPLPSAPLDIPAFIHAAPAANGKVPAAAAGFSRIGFIMALVLAGVALLISIGAGWMALNATQKVQGMEMAAAPSAGDPRIAKLQNDVSALRKQVDDLSRAVEGSLSELGGRVAVLEKANGVASPATAAPVEPANRKSEPPTAPKPVPVAPEAPKTTAKPAGPAPDAAKGQPPVAEAPKSPAPKAPAPASGPAPAAQQPAAPPTAAATAPAAAAPVAPAAKPAAKAKPAPVPKAGDWVVHLTSSDEKQRAEAQLSHARAKGLSARLTTGSVEGRTWYRVTVEGFATPEEARAFAGKQAIDAGFSAAWIGKK